MYSPLPVLSCSCDLHLLQWFEGFWDFCSIPRSSAQPMKCQVILGGCQHRYVYIIEMNSLPFRGQCSNETSWNSSCCVLNQRWKPRNYLAKSHSTLHVGLGVKQLHSIYDTSYSLLISCIFNCINKKLGFFKVYQATNPSQSFSTFMGSKQLVPKRMWSL